MSVQHPVPDPSPDPSADPFTDPSPAGGLRCSARGCREPATIDLSWRNPRLHDAARVKHWLACAEHADRLADFLARRGFLLGRDPIVP